MSPNDTHTDTLQLSIVLITIDRSPGTNYLADTLKQLLDIDKQQG